MKQYLRISGALLAAVGLCVVAFAILNKHFLVGIGLLVIAAILASCMYLKMNKWYFKN